jgi:hypothetical protein
VKAAWQGSAGQRVETIDAQESGLGALDTHQFLQKGAAHVPLARILRRTHPDE